MISILNIAKMLMYSPKKLVYPDDEKMHMVTSMSKSAHTKKTRGPNSISLGQFRAGKRIISSRLCEDLDELCHHINQSRE